MAPAPIISPASRTMCAGTGWPSAPPSSPGSGIEYDYWDELSGGTRLAVEAATRIHAGVTPFGVPNDGVLAMAQAVADGARFPALILVTTGLGGSDLLVLEGHPALLLLVVRSCDGSLFGMG